MELPRGYQKRLQRSDSLLRMRWSEPSWRWFLERKATYARADIDPAGLAPDTYIQRRDGYLTLWTYGPRDLPTIDRLLQVLGWGDTWRMGGANAVSSELEANESRREDVAAAWDRRNTEDRTSDYYDQYVAEQGARSYAGAAITGAPR